MDSCSRGIVLDRPPDRPKYGGRGAQEMAHGYSAVKRSKKEGAGKHPAPDRSDPPTAYEHGSGLLAQISQGGAPPLKTKFTIEMMSADVTEPLQFTSPLAWQG
jgi:hypothetical protein